MLNLNKIVVAFAIPFLLTICGCATHHLPLSKPETDIRAAVLKITPLGTPIDETATLIKRKFHPETFYYGDKINGMFSLNWPHGVRNVKKEFVCQIAIIGFVLNPIQVNAYWAFDKRDRLIDVGVSKYSYL